MFEISFIDNPFERNFQAAVAAYIGKYPPIPFSGMKDGHYGDIYLNPDGNEKLINTPIARFLIFSLRAIVTCPFSTPHCRKYCYADKAETQYQDCRETRERNVLASLRDDFAERMIELIEHYRKYDRKYNHGKGRTTIVRIHESGDFYSKKYYEKWVQIARHFVCDPGIIFAAYTKSVEYVGDPVSNFTIRYSIWDDTEPEQIELARIKNLPTYTAARLTEEMIEELGPRHCRCADCATCQKCYHGKVKDIVAEIH